MAQTNRTARREAGSAFPERSVGFTGPLAQVGAPLLLCWGLAAIISVPLRANRVRTTANTGSVFQGAVGGGGGVRGVWWGVRVRWGGGGGRVAYFSVYVVVFCCF